MKRFGSSRCPGIELILIDNGRKFRRVSDPRLTLVRAGQNLLVNPSWNLGVALARNDVVCLLNDDLVVDLDFLLTAWTSLKPRGEWGVVGLGNCEVSGLDIEPVDVRHAGFGCMLLARKSAWQPIPSCIKVFYGDDWLFWRARVSGKQNYAFHGLGVSGRMSLTSSDFGQFMISDHEAFAKLLDYDQRR